MRLSPIIAIVIIALTACAAGSKLIDPLPNSYPLLPYTLSNDLFPETGVPPIKGKSIQSYGNTDSAGPNNHEAALIAPAQGTHPTNPLYIETTCEGKEDNGECKKGWWTKFLTDPNSTFAGFVAIFTLFLVLVGVGNIAVVYQQKEIGREQLVMLQEIESPNPVITTIKATEYSNENSVNPVRDPIPEGMLPGFFRILLLLSNFGRRDAIIFQINVRWVISPTLPPQPMQMQPPLQVNYVVRQGETIWFRLDPMLNVSVTEEQRDAIMDGAMGLWVYGSFSYFRFGRSRRDVGFLWKWDNARGFVNDPRPNYTYERDSQQT
jgi:hypothetical protein